MEVLIPNMAGEFYPVMKVLYRYYKLKSGKWKKKVSILYQYASVDCTWKSFQKYSRIENIRWFQIGIGIHVHDLEVDNSSLIVDNKFRLLDCWSLSGFYLKCYLCIYYFKEKGISPFEKLMVKSSKFTYHYEYTRWPAVHYVYV